MQQPLSEFIASACSQAMMDLAYPPRVSPVYQSGSDVPSIVYQQVGELTIESLDGWVNEGTRFQIDIRTIKYADLEALDRAILSAMREQGADRIMSIETASDLIEDDIAEERVYRRLRSIVLD